MQYRLFISVDPPDDIRYEIHELCTGLERIRWTPEEQIHLTMRFIGPGDAHLVEDMCEELSEIPFDPFEIAVRGTGHFPLRGEPKVLWAGIEPSEELKTLYRNISTALTRCGIPREGRNFMPHITLGRLKRERIHTLGQWLSRTSTYSCGPFPVEKFHLYTSRLRPEGAIHEKLASF